MLIGKNIAFTVYVNVWTFLFIYFHYCKLKSETRGRVDLSLTKVACSWRYPVLVIFKAKKRDFLVLFVLNGQILEIINCRMH